MRRILSSALIALSISAEVSAQNLLANPDFDDDIAGWTDDVDWITGSFDDEDYAGIPESGSARVVNTRDVAGADGIHQCVTIPESDGTVAYDGTVWLRVADGESVDGFAGLVLWFVANDTCDLGGLVLGSVAPIAGAEIWNELGVHAGIYPAATRSVRFDLRVDKFVEGGDAAALFDHAYLPEPESGATAAGAGAALVALLRRGRGV